MKTKTCLITGAASGLGFQFAKLALQDNYDVVLVDIDKDQLLEAQRKLQLFSRNTVSIIHRDLGTPNAAHEIYNHVHDLNIDMLINNAGFGLYGNFCDTDWETEERMINLHILTISQLTKLILKDMVQKDTGKILILSSLAAFQPGPMMAIYYATKSYLLSFSEALSRELANTGVSVTALCPGPTDTNFQLSVDESKNRGNIKFNLAKQEPVAMYGYKALKRNLSVAIPGRFNKFLAFLPRVLPRSLVTIIVLRIQTSNRGMKMEALNKKSA